MKKRIYEKYRQGQTAFGIWVTQACPAITEIAAELQLDWICVDMEHGHLDYSDIAEHLRAARGSDLTVLVRVATLAEEPIKRVLDLGVDGILLPRIRSRRELESVKEMALYPPEGHRGIGGERAQGWGLTLERYVAEANREIMIIPLIETAEAVEEIAEILDLDGIGPIFFGPADLSASYGYLGEWEGGDTAKKILEIQAMASDRGIPSGVMATGTPDAIRRRDQGFAMVGIGSDMGLLIRQLGETKKALFGDSPDHRWF